MSYPYPPAYVDAAGYPAAGYASYPPAYAYPPPPGGPWMGYGGPDQQPYGYSAASCAAYPPPPPAAAALYGGYSPAELYSHGQQYGMTPRDVDEALVEYQELSNSSSGRVQRGEDMTDRGMLGDAILNFRLPSIMEFLTLIGSNRMQFVPATAAVPVYPVPFGCPPPVDKKKEDPSSQPATL